MVDGKEVRTLDELRENFNLDDVLKHFYSGKLQKWLASRDYKHELDQVKDIASSNKLDVSCKLLDIFKIEYDKDDLKYFIDETNQYKALDQETAAGNNSEQAQKNCSNIFPIRTSKLAFDCSDNESSGSYGAYQRLIEEICMHDHKIDLIKQKLNIIVSEHLELYLKDRLNLIAIFISESPYAVLAMIDNPKAFNPFLPALLKLNQVIKAPLSSDENCEIGVLKRALTILQEMSILDQDKIFDNFSNIMPKESVSQSSSITLNKCLLLFSFTLSLINYNISDEQWQIIAEKCYLSLDNKLNDAYEEYQSLIFEIKNYWNKPDKAKLKLDIILSKYYEFYLKEKLNIIAFYNYFSSFSLLAIFDSPKAFNPFLPALLKFNKIIKEPLSVEEEYEIRLLESGLEQTVYHCWLDDEDINSKGHFVNLLSNVKGSTVGSFDCDKCMLLFTDIDEAQIGFWDTLYEKAPDAKMPFTPLLMFNNDISGFISNGITSVCSNDDYSEETYSALCITLDLFEYDISYSQWRLIAERDFTLCDAVMGTYAEYQTLINEICMHDHKIGLIKHKLDIIVSKYNEFYLKDRLELIDRFSKESPYAVVAIIDNPKAFNPFLLALVKFNKKIEAPLSADELYDIRALHSALRTLEKRKSIFTTQYKNIVYKFTHIKVKEKGPCELKKFMLLFTNINSKIQFPCASYYDEDDDVVFDDLLNPVEVMSFVNKYISFEPLIICNIENKYNVQFTATDEPYDDDYRHSYKYGCNYDVNKGLFFILDLKDYDISEEDWQLIYDHCYSITKEYSKPAHLYEDYDPADYYDVPKDLIDPFDDMD